MDSSLEETSADSESGQSEVASALVEASTDSESLPSLVLEPVSDGKVLLSEIPCKWAHKRSTRSALEPVWWRWKLSRWRANTVDGNRRRAERDDGNVEDIAGKTKRELKLNKN